MIVVSVALDSARGPHEDRNLFTMVIGNDTTGTDAYGNYNIYLGRRGITDPMKVYKNPLRVGHVKRHPRLRSHVGELVRKALESVDL